MFDYCNFLRTNWDNCISADNEIVTLLSRLELAPLKFDPKKVETQQCFAVINAKNTLAGYIKKGENSSIEAKLIHDSGISIKVSVFFQSIQIY